ncbi:MAG: protein-(glutamine-N5) methyltransferase, release factor-specific [Lentisphaerae bacterium GWF2_57_35]|nr:MAG: protein-(glutamine-N5) methyltransferase, release factor-specific [Lentisphaerae bacterium GWF2_57_35]
MNFAPDKDALRQVSAALESDLKSAGVEEAGLTAMYLLSHVLGCRRLEVGLRAQDVLADAQAHELNRLAARMKAGEPLQYVLGDVEFLGRLFKTDPRALIARPETELLVEWALASSDVWARSGPRVVDVGTGTGCIAVSLALERPAARIMAVDLSAEALALARENARSLGVEARMAFYRADLLASFAPGSLDAVVSNPPYIASEECARLPRHIREHEPRLALDGGSDGLFTISRLVEQAAFTLKSGGRLYMEIGEEQASPVRRLLAEAGFVQVEIRKDWNGHDRMAGGLKP